MINVKGQMGWQEKTDNKQKTALIIRAKLQLYAMYLYNVVYIL